jgi:fatty acid desaturase
VLKFGPGDEFHQELRRRIDRYFTRTGLKRRDCPQMYLKTAVVLGWLAASYVLLVFVAGSWWLALPLAMACGWPPLRFRSCQLVSPDLMSVCRKISPATGEQQDVVPQ